MCSLQMYYPIGIDIIVVMLKFAKVTITCKMTPCQSQKVLSQVLTLLRGEGEHSLGDTPLAPLATSLL